MSTYQGSFLSSSSMWIFFHYPHSLKTTLRHHQWWFGLQTNLLRKSRTTRNLRLCLSSNVTLNSLSFIFIFSKTCILYFIVVVLLQLFQFSPFALPCSTHLSHSQSPRFCSCPWVLYTCLLIRPFPFFAVNPLPPPLWSLSVCSLFSCLRFYVAHLFVLFIRFLL